MTPRPNQREQEQEWLRQDNLTYAALLGVGIVLVQPFLTSGELDTSATVCVIAFAVAIPLLAALVMLNRQETYLGVRAASTAITVAKPVAQTASLVGLVAAFWHITWVGGLIFMVAAATGSVVYLYGYRRLESDD